MRRRFNFTGRVALKGRNASVRLTKTPEGRFQFDAFLDFSDLSLPADGRVFVEAYFQATRKRFSFGLVSKVAPPSMRFLDEFGDPQAVLFRVKVLGQDGRPVLLADADQLSPQDVADDASRRSLLSFVASDLGETAWRVQLRETNYPLLHVNKELPDPLNLTQTDPRFHAFVFPAVIRQVLHHVLVTEKFVSDPDPDPVDRWMNEWVQFGERLTSTQAPEQVDGEPDVEACSIWIGSVIDAFASQLGSVTKARKAMIGD
ncbi:MAG: hypothetical protein KF754_00460 [Planctomycetes bacterium]|nr:hypothetical protein [Planctomycetota bacterium]